MKYCPKCGTPLNDEAKFCSKCGAPQPGVVIEKEPVKEEVRVAPEVTKPMSPKERYNDLLKNDECFRDSVKVIRTSGLISLTNLLFIIPFILSYVIPVGVFTGVNVGNPSLAASLNITFPFEYSASQIMTLGAVSLAGEKLAPSDLGTSPMLTIVLIVGILIAIALPFTSLFGRPKGYLLRTYEGADGKRALLKEAKNPPSLLGGMATIFTFTPGLVTYVGSYDQNYNGKTYIFGEVDVLTPNFIGLAITVGLFAAVLIAGQIVVANVLYNKKLKKYED